MNVEQHASTKPARAAKRPVARWLRIFLPVVLILVWFTAASVGGPYFGKIDEVSSNDQTSYLPASADATRVQEKLAEFNDDRVIPAIVVFTADEGELTTAQTEAITALRDTLGDIEGVSADSSPAIPSEDGKAAQAFVLIDQDAEVAEIVEEMRATLTENSVAGVTGFVTGPAGFTADLGEAFAGIDGILLLVALGAVFLILIIVYRSPILPFLVLGTSVFALTAALLTVWWLAKAGVVALNGQVQGILFILVIGAATDYSLLYVSRYKEALREHENRWDATWAAIKTSLEPIIASGGTVIVGLLCLLFSDLNSNKALGPVSAIGILFSVLASLTLLPALLYACGRTSFWPLRPRFVATVPAEPHGSHATPERHGVHAAPRGVWPWLARLIKRRHRVTWIVSTGLLLVACFGVFSLNAQGVSQSDLILGESEARDGQVALGEHFAKGSGSPAYVLAPEGELADVAATVLDATGIESLAITSADSPSGSAAVDPSGELSIVGGPPAGTPGVPAVMPEPTVVDGQVLLQATLSDAADSAAAKEAVVSLREALAEQNPDILVGGVTATAIDSDTASIHDRNTIIPIVLAVILVILMLLLRSVLAPVLLIGSVVISFGAALGVSAWVFNDVFKFPGADPAVPLYGFVFLVALGIDYNIFLMTRVREESLVHGTHEGILRGLVATGGVITSAGIVLAATFAALSVIPILFLAQIAFIVSFGVLLDTLIVRSLLVPALSYDLGSRIWWPSKLASRR